MLENVDTSRIQYIAIVISILFFLFIIELIREKKLKEQYSLLWLFSSILFIVFSIWRGGLHSISRLLGIAYPPAAFFLIFFMAVFLILIQFSVIISKLSEENKKLAQEIGLLKKEMEEKSFQKNKKTESGLAGFQDEQDKKKE
ncbi:MAG: DUF2304 domain-containing protein [Candidatus Cloacimonetes bacterium]|nr:DUF2304 domain-containing protein [Candidatus Cloacimonadota bacterium]